MMNKVNLFLVGAAKSGTTSLATLLSDNESIYISDIKEPHYFLNDHGVKTIKEYERLFVNRNERYLLDASTGYLYDEQACDKIYKYNKDAKILIILRNPIDMVSSFWEYMKANGQEQLDFSSAISVETESYRLSEEFKRNCEQWHCNYLYRYRAAYYEQVERYISRFGVENVHVSLFEDIVNNKVALKEIYDFLDLSFDEEYLLPKDNKSGVSRPIIHWLRFSKLFAFPKRLYKACVPTKYRINVRNFVIEKSMTQRGYSKIKVDGELRQSLREYYAEDVKKTRALLPELDFNMWGDFSE